MRFPSAFSKSIGFTLEPSSLQTSTLTEEPYDVKVIPIIGDNSLEAIAYDDKGKKNTARTLLVVDSSPELRISNLPYGRIGAYYNYKIPAIGNGDLTFNGEGFPKDIITKIGEPYIKSIQSKNKSKSGLGLGIFIGKTLLEKNKAKLLIRNSETRGGAEIKIEWSNKDLKNI